MLENKKGVFSSDGMEDLALKMGMRWFISSLTVFLLASVVAIVVIRVQVPEWPDLPVIPGALWWSTGILLVSTMTLQKIKKQWSPKWFWISIIFIFAFLTLQVIAAMQWHQAIVSSGQSKDVAAIAKMALYVLIFLHGMHVVGGLVPLTLVATPSGYQRRKSLVPLFVTYWDFICCIWILFFIVILLLR